MVLNYENVSKAMFAFGRLLPREREVVEFLWNCDVFKGGVSDLTRSMGRPDTDIPNILKVVRTLQSMGVVYVFDVHDAKAYGSKKHMFLLDGWIDKVVEASNR